MNGNELSFEKKAILALYRRFYGSDYVPEVGRRHAHSCVYLSSLVGIECGGFSFLSDGFVPFSFALEGELDEIDRIPDVVRKFYDDGFSEAFSGNVGEPFLPREGELVERVSSALEIPKRAGKIRTWPEVLSFVVFMKKSVRPNATRAEFVERFSERPFVEDAWDVLSRVGFVRDGDEFLEPTEFLRRRFA